MPKRRTTKLKRTRKDKVTYLQVRTPRIVAFQALSVFKGLFKFCLFLAILGGAAWGLRNWAADTFLKNDEFLLTQITLETDGCLTESRVIEVGDIDLGCSLFDIKVDELEKKLTDLPEVLTAEVTRKLPGSLLVHATERRAVAWMECRALGIAGRVEGEGGFLFDKSGVIFPCSYELFSQVEALPVISIGQEHADDLVVGEEIQNGNVLRAVALADESLVATAEQPRIDRIVLLNSYSMEAWLSNGSKALFGMHGHRRQLNDLYTILSNAYDKGKQVIEVNLIPKRNIPVKYRSKSSASASETTQFIAVR